MLVALAAGEKSRRFAVARRAGQGLGVQLMCKSFILRAVAAALLAAVIWGPAGARAESIMAACAAQWKQAQAAGTTGGATWPQFLARCKTQAAQPASAAPAPAPAPAQAPAPSGGPLFPWWQQPAQNAAPAPTGAGQFGAEAEARARCPSDKVVWVNTASKVYHYQGTRYYARTRHGAFMCEADARAAGDRVARSFFGRQQQ